MRLHKKEIARRQIDTAIELVYRANDFVSITTLAGASEEILGELLRREGKVNVFDHLIALGKSRGATGWDVNEVNAVANRARNNFKHAHDPHEDEGEFSFEEAIAMLTRAVANYTSLYNDPTPQMLKFAEHIISQYPDSAS